MKKILKLAKLFAAKFAALKIHRIEPDKWQIGNVVVHDRKIQEAAKTQKWDGFVHDLGIDSNIVGQAAREVAPHNFDRWLDKNQSPRPIAEDADPIDKFFGRPTPQAAPKKVMNLDKREIYELLQKTYYEALMRGMNTKPQNPFLGIGRGPATFGSSDEYPISGAPGLKISADREDGGKWAETSWDFTGNHDDGWTDPDSPADVADDPGWPFHYDKIEEEYEKGERKEEIDWEKLTDEVIKELNRKFNEVNA